MIYYKAQIDLSILNATIIDMHIRNTINMRGIGQVYIK